MSNALTLGVVGHVDHGKTTLVRSVTGIETDRLREERERGLSIVLGFAFIETEHGIVDLIDVPGHEDFVRAMIGGATALDGIVLCVAANEGVMPQTVEHFNIARLLGVARGFAVITKTDLVNEEQLTLVRGELEAFLQGTFLEGAPMIEVSAPTGAGIDAVHRALTGLTATPVQREVRGRFFLPLDRVFSMRGFGLVVTGTLRGGELSVRDAVEITPSRRLATVRALQNHNRPVGQVAPGQRVAVNLRHVNRDEIKRGDVLASPGSIVPTARLDTQLRLLEDADGAVKNGTVMRLLTGTTEAMAKLRLLDRRELASGETAMVQLNLDREIATRPTEHFLIRSYSPAHTVGGGRILEVNAKRHRRFDAAVAQRLETVASGDLERVVKQRLEAAGGQGVRPEALAGELNVGRGALREIARLLGAVFVSENLVVASDVYDALLSEVVTALERFHRQYPFKNGIDVGSLIGELGSQPSPEVARHVVRHLTEQNTIRNAQEILSIAGFDPFASLDDRERKLLGEIEREFLSGGLESPSPEVVIASDDARRAAYGLLLETGRLVRLKTYDRKSQLVLHASVLEDAKRTIEREYPHPQAFAVKDIRNLLGSTRKYVMPLMEHLDATGATVRTGDLRRLRTQ